MTSDSQEVIIYSLLKSSIIHVEKNVTSCHADKHHVVMCKNDMNIYTYSTKKGKTSKLLSLSHELEDEG